MAELVIVQPNGPDQVVGLYRHQNSRIIGQRIGGAGGQYVALRDFQGWKSRWQLIESAPSGGGFDADGPGAESVVVPESLFQGSVDKKPEVVVVILYAFTPSGKVPFRS